MHDKWNLIILLPKRRKDMKQIKKKALFKEIDCL